MENMSTENSRSQQPELWGGIECTINRVDDQFRDQLQYANHYERTEDIEKIKTLGIKKLRYPLLWEHHQPSPKTRIDWTWTTRQLAHIRDAGIEPIAGLVHHGSGPFFTDLMDPEFPRLLAEYAGKVAKQFPWINYYTPINEPLTTARFSGLYGFWYPHKKDDASFTSIFLNQLKAVVLSMQAIRKVNPKAKLVQTEDCTKIHSTELLQYQAYFENQRRWLTYDFLCGRVNKEHVLWNYFRDAGIREEQLNFFIENPCPPDIIGCNYYVTSERWLDENLENYPAETHGHNGRHHYADTEAVRGNKQVGLGPILTETWERFQIPIAITECHLGCSREEQMRWLYETYTTCKELVSTGIDIIAVTAWSLLGAYDWNSLLTRENFFYEPGVFDIADQKNVRPTALVKLVRGLAERGDYSHPLLEQKGWWNKKDSLRTKKTAPIVIIGKHGTLASAFRRICKLRSIPIISLGRDEINITDPASIEAMIHHYKPWAIINTAGYVKVDEAETNEMECFRINSVAPRLMARICQRKGIRFMTFSSDLVFDGGKQTPYIEEDVVHSLNVYGRSKERGEKGVLHSSTDALVIRTSSFFGPWDQYNFVYYVLDSLKNEKTFQAANDVIISPTYVPDLVHRSLDLFIDEEKGIWHITNDGHISWSDLAEAVADRAGYSKKKIQPAPVNSLNLLAPRPLYSVLGTEKGGKLPSIDNALERYFQEQIA
jgi:dTDP-4-dehydrorhamnose reductase